MSLPVARNSSIAASLLHYTTVITTVARGHALAEVYHFTLRALQGLSLYQIKPSSVTQGLGLPASIAGPLLWFSSSGFLRSRHSRSLTVTEPTRTALLYNDT